MLKGDIVNRGDAEDPCFQSRFHGCWMNNILAFLNNTWFRLSGVFVGAVLSLFVISAVFNFFVITPIELDVRDSRRGVSRFEGGSFQ